MPTLREPARWPILRSQLQAACDELKHAGYQVIEVRGAMRLPTWFTVGTELKEVAGFDVVSAGSPLSWTSEEETSETPVTSVTTCGRAVDLAVAVAVSGDPTKDVLQYVASEGIPVGECITFTPSSGASPQAIRTPGQATGLARSVVRYVRARLTDSATPRIHLFMYAPNGFALMLGHLWDRLPPTQLYDFVGPGLGYLPSFLIAGPSSRPRSPRER